MLRLEGVEAEFLRQPSAFVPRSYTLEKQLIRLVDHLFVRYPVPRFLYQVFFPSSDPFAHKHLLYRKWFAAISRGDSFRKLAHDHMTAREAALFLAAPKTDYVHRNVWWARMKAAGLPDHAIYCLLRRIFGKHDFEDPDGRVRSAITYFVRFRKDFDHVTFDEVLDFLDWKFEQVNDFKLTGRTAASVIRLSNEWHCSLNAERINTAVRWKGLKIKDWSLESEFLLWRVKQLKSNRELREEGMKQCHCVYSYVNNCVNGTSAIFSLRTYPRAHEDAEGEIWDFSQEDRHITIEVDWERELVQAKGKLNRSPDKEETGVIRKWASDASVRLPDWWGNSA